MKESPLAGFLRSLRGSAFLAGIGDLEDRQLLERFLKERDEAAFEVIVRRHGPMVFGVCRRLLGDVHAAEDAFQATFLVLVRKAGKLRSRQLLAQWLYGVATRTALKARTQGARRQKHEKLAAAKVRSQDSHPNDVNDFSVAIEEELGRLPQKYRLPVILCHMEDMTLEEASGKLGWPVGTVSGRLSRARAILRERIARRALVPLMTLPDASILEQLAGKVVPPTLLRTTLDAAAALAAGRPAAGAAISTGVALLTKGVIHEMFWSQVKTVVVLFLAAGTMAGVGAVGLGQRAGPQAEVKKEQAKPEESPEEFIGRTKRELLKVHPGWAFPEPNQGDEAVVPPRLAPPIPKLADETLKEALASTRILEKMKPLLQARLDAAEIEAETRWMEFVAGRGTLNIMFGAYERLLRSELAINPDRDFQIAALEANLKGSQEILKVNKARYEAGRIAVHDLAESQFYYEDAKIRLEQAKEAAR